MTERICPHCGCDLTPPKKPRSHQQLKRVMALCRAAFHHWPSSVEFRPKNEEHLRYFLECEAGHFEVEQTIRIGSDATPEVIAGYVSGVMRSSRDHKMFVEIDGTLIVVKRVKSIAYEKLEHPDACRLFNAIDEVLHSYGFNPDQLLRETEQAA